MYIRYIVVLVATALSCHYPQPDTLLAQYAGSWYPGDGAVLRNQLRTLSTHVVDVPFFDPEHISAIIAPHAGYQYSGSIAAVVYRMVRGKTCDRIIVIGPAHQALTGCAWVPAARSYKVPTGSLKIDQGAIKQLLAMASPCIEIDNGPFLQEHSVEMQLPWLVHTWGTKVPIVPLLVGPVMPDGIHQLAHALKQIITPRTLVIISTDFIHYGKVYQYTPAGGQYREWVRSLDNLILQSIQSGDTEKFEHIIGQSHATVCGYNPLRILLRLLHVGMWPDKKARLVAYGNSQEASVPVAGDDTLVSYAGLVVCPTTKTSSLTEYDKQELVAIARAALHNSVGPTDTPSYIPVLSSALFDQKGVFVTLYTRDMHGQRQLRGCIGRIMPDKPLYQLVAEVTRESALHDIRFSPVQADEMARIELEISVVELPHAVKSYRDIVLGTDGIIMQLAGRSALFLPQVATEFGWTREQTLRELSLKAGLSGDAWKDKNAQFQVFRATYF